MPVCGCVACADTVCVRQLAVLDLKLVCGFTPLSHSCGGMRGGLEAPGGNWQPPRFGAPGGSGSLQLTIWVHVVWRVFVRVCVVIPVFGKSIGSVAEGGCITNLGDEKRLPPSNQTLCSQSSP